MRIRDIEQNQVVTLASYFWTFFETSGLRAHQPFKIQHFYVIHRNESADVAPQVRRQPRPPAFAVPLHWLSTDRTDQIGRRPVLKHRWGKKGGLRDVHSVEKRTGKWIGNRACRRQIALNQKENGATSCVLQRGYSGFCWVNKAPLLEIIDWKGAWETSSVVMACWKLWNEDHPKRHRHVAASDNA